MRIIILNSTVRAVVIVNNDCVFIRTITLNLTVVIVNSDHDSIRIIILNLIKLSFVSILDYFS